MRCIRCGTETESSAVFCTHCLEEMEKFPVKSDTPIILPSQKKLPQKSTIKIVRTEERINQLKHTVRILMVIVLLLSIALGVVSFLLIKANKENNKNPIGQNYSSSEESSPPIKGSVSG